MESLFRKRNFLKNTSEFLSHVERSYTVIVRYTDGSSIQHKNIKNPWGYKKKIKRNLYIERVNIIPED